MIDGPDDDSVLRCKPRVEELVRLSECQLVVSVGRLSGRWLDPEYPHGIKLPGICARCGWQVNRVPQGVSCKRAHLNQAVPMPQLEVIHPAAILRKGIGEQALAIQTARVDLDEAFGSLKVRK
jgi:hypothetical protein